MSTDSYADLEKHYAGDSWAEAGHNAYGVVKQLYALKQQNRHVKVMYSVGGFSASQQGHFARAASTEQGRQRFAQSAVQVIADWGFDGLDIDWEFPSTQGEARQFVQLLEACRGQLDKYAARLGQEYRYELSVASSAGRKNYGKLPLKDMDAVVDAWYLMAYDFAGTWDSTAGHQSSLFRDETNPNGTKFWTEQAVADYIAAGVSSRKIILGIPLYGRSFARAAGPGSGFSGPGGGSVQDGVWLYRDLPRPGAREYTSDALGAAWSIGNSSQAHDGGAGAAGGAGGGGGAAAAAGQEAAATTEFVSYDNPRTVRTKAAYIQQRQLGGAFYWEASGDKNGSDSLVGIMAAALRRHPTTNNMLSYPESRYDNIRNGLR
ncbi:hypothetical protein CDD82_1129 [Ophiocordyceps australis]|uniref:chitinase n=1 Tax=Ophiocordyceps australis TaxID=1399860 RepID=A0A2C5YGB7_9HYPO|nr:hypothetical protein CDD82_1129 [Ophiocordyceps australis]